MAVVDIRLADGGGIEVALALWDIHDIRSVFATAHCDELKRLPRDYQGLCVEKLFDASIIPEALRVVGAVQGWATRLRRVLGQEFMSQFDHRIGQQDLEVIEVHSMVVGSLQAVLGRDGEQPRHRPRASAGCPRWS
jgi:hypothetical protein